MAMKSLTGFDANNQRIVNVSDPSGNTDAATKQYVDAVARGLKWKDSVVAATTAAGTLATDYENGDVIDGVTLATGDRILIKNQSTGSQNGIYVVNASGAPTRATDLSTTSSPDGVAVSVTEGTVNGDKVFLQTTDGAVVGTDTLTFTQLGGGGATYNADGNGIELSGSTFSLELATTSGLTKGAGGLAVGAGNGITVNANDVALASSAAGNGLTYSAGVLNVVNTNGDITVSANSIDLAAGVAGNGLDLASGVLSVKTGTASATGLEISSDTVRIATDAAGAGLTGGGGSALAVGAGTGITVNADDVAINTSLVAQKYNTSIGNGTNTSYTITHNLGTKDVIVQLRQNSDDVHVYADVVSTSTTQVTVTFATAPSSNAIRVTVIG